MLTDRQIDRNTIDRNTTKYYINAQWQFPLLYAQLAAYTTYLLSFQFYLAKAVQKKAYFLTKHIQDISGVKSQENGSLSEKGQD